MYLFRKYEIAVKAALVAMYVTVLATLATRWH